MANDSTTPSDSLERDTVSDTFFHSDTQDSVFTTVQVAQADGIAAPAATPGTPQPVEIPADATVVRVAVTPGEILVLGEPFAADATLIGRIGDGNLAIKVGDVTVILEGYVNANDQAPVTVEAANGQPIDVATMLASTDPALDIQTAAGPGTAAGPQGADNTGAILTQFGNGTGLGGFSAVGTQDGTELNYGLIDNAIRQDLTGITLGTTPFSFTATGPLGPLNEAFLHDPINTFDWSSYQEFATSYFADGQGNWADFFGTLSDAPDYLESLHQQAEVHTSTSPATVLLTGIDNIANLTSDGSPLGVEMADGNETAFIYRQGDHALIAVVHVVVDPTDPTTFHIDTYLINRLDDLDANGNPTDATSLVVDFSVYDGEVSVEPSQEGDVPAGGLPGTATFDVSDDAPLMAPENPAADTVTEGEKPNTIDGTFDFNFGADGPLDAPLVGGGEGDVVALLSSVTSAVELGLKITDPDNGGTVYLQFEDGALAVSNLTSGGNPVDVVESHDIFGHTILTGSIDGGATTIFTITVTDATGAWTFELDGPLDHPDKGETGGDDQFQFDLTATITDDDLDAASGSETFFVNDGGVTVEPPSPPQGDDQNPASYAPGTLVYESGLASGSDPSADTETTTGTVTITAFDGISAITVAGVPVDLNVIANTSVIHGAHGDLTITGWNPATGELDYSYTLLTADPDHSAAGNDIIQGEDFSVVATDGDGDSTTADITISIVDDVPTAVDDPLGTVLVDGSAQVVGNILTNDSNGADPNNSTKTISDVTGATATASGWDIVEADGSGTVHVAKDGTVTFTANPGHDFTVPDDISFDYTIVDGDGDTSTATVSFTAEVRGTSLPPADDLTVDESKLPDGSQGGGGTLTDSKTITLPDGFTVDTGDLGDHTLPSGILTISQAGKDVTYSYTLNATFDDGTLGVSDGRNVVDGADSANTFDLHVSGPFGQTGTIAIDVTIQDDVPTANDDTDGVNSGATVTGGVETNDVFGADGKLGGTGVIGVGTGSNTAVPAPGTPGVPIATSLGTLTLSDDGSYTYVAKPNVSGVDHFVYTISDADGDLSTTTLDITVNQVAPDTDTKTVTVDEAALPTGSNPSSNDEVQSGKLVLTNGATATAGDYPGLYGTLHVESDGNFTYTLTTDLLVAGADKNTVLDAEVFNITIQDLNGNTAIDQIKVNVIDDVPSDFDPQDQSLLNSPAGGVITGALDITGHTGADGYDSIVFSGGTDGDPAMLSDGVTAATYQGHAILLSGFGTATLTGYADLNDDGVIDPGETAVFKVVLDGANDTYTFQLLKDLDDGQQIDFTNLSNAAPGNNYWLGSGINEGDASSKDLLLTAKDFGAGDSDTVNTSQQGIGSNDARLNGNEGIRMDFVTGLTTAPGSTTNTKNGFDFTDHYQVQDFQFKISKVDGSSSSTTSLKLTATDVTNAANGSATSEADFLAGTLVTLTAADIKVFHGTTDITNTITFTTSGGSVIVGNLHEGDVIQIHETSGFDRLEVDAAGGSKFSIADAQVTETIAGNDLSLSFDTTLKDGDGDTSAGNSIGITLQTDDGEPHTFTGGPGDDTMHGGSGDDTLSGGGGTDYIFGDAGNDSMLYDSADTFNGGAGFDRVIVTTGGNTIAYDGARFLAIEMIDLGDTNDRSGSANQNTLVLNEADVVGTNAGTVAGHQISFFVIGDNTGAADDRDNVQLAGFTKIDTGTCPDPVTGTTHTYDVYQSTNHPTVNVAIEQDLNVT